MMDMPVEAMKQITAIEHTAMGLVAIVVFCGVLCFVYTAWKGIPAFIAYLKEKDEKHRQDIINIMTAAREERDKFYATLAVKVDRVHDRIDGVNKDVRGEMSEVKDRLGRIETTMTQKPNQQP